MGCKETHITAIPLCFGFEVSPFFSLALFEGNFVKSPIFVTTSLPPSLRQVFYMLMVSPSWWHEGYLMLSPLCWIGLMLVLLASTIMRSITITAFIERLTFLEWVCWTKTWWIESWVGVCQPASTTDHLVTKVANIRRTLRNLLWGNLGSPLPPLTENHRQFSQ